MQISAQNRSQKFHTSNEYIFNVMPVIWGWPLGEGHGEKWICR